MGHPTSSAEVLDHWDETLRLGSVDHIVSDSGSDLSGRIDELSGLLGIDDVETGPYVLQMYEAMAKEVIEISSAVNPFGAAEDNITYVAGSLPVLNADDLQSRLRSLEGVENSLEGLLEHASTLPVSFTDRVRIAHLIHKVRAARYRLEHPHQVSSPNKYIEPLGQLMCSLLREGYGTNMEVSHAFGTFFDELPRYLSDARRLIEERVSAGEPVFATSLEEAKSTIPQLLELLDGDVTARFSDISDFPDCIASAKESLQTFLTFLEGLTGHPTEGFAVGADNLRDIYKYERGLGDIDPAKLVELGKSEVATLKEQVLALRRTLAERYGIEVADDMPQAEFMKQLRPQMHFAEDKEGLFDLCRKAFDTANDFFTSEEGRRFVPALPCTINVKNAPAFLQKYGFMILFANLFDREADLPAAEYWLGADVLPISTNPMCSLEHLVEVGTHEVTPGHINQGRFIKTNPDVSIRTGSPDNIALIEGWGLFAEEIAYEAGFFDYAANRLGLDADVIKMFYWQARLLRAGRMVADPGLQTGTMTQEGVAQFLTDECLQDPAFAKGQASYYPLLPGYPSTYYPGHMFLKALRDTSADMLASVMSRDEARLWFYKVYLEECGTMAAPLVSRYVVGRTLQERSRLERGGNGVASAAASAIHEPVGSVS